MTEMCHSSALSYLGSLVSVLTFILGIAAYYITFFTLTRSALSEIDSLKLDLDITRRQLLPIFECYTSEVCRGPLDPNGALKRSIEALQVSSTAIYDELAGLKEEHGVEECRWKWGEVKRRLTWVYRRKEIREKMRRFERQQVGVHVCYMGLLLWCVSSFPDTLVLSNFWQGS